MPASPCRAIQAIRSTTDPGTMTGWIVRETAKGCSTQEGIGSWAPRLATEGVPQSRLLALIADDIGQHQPSDCSDEKADWKEEGRSEQEFTHPPCSDPHYK